MLASDFKRYVVSTLIAILSVLSLWLMTDDNMGGIKGLNAKDVKQKGGNFETSTVQTDTNQGTLLALGVLFFIGILAGKLTKKIYFALPELIGMMIVGFVLRNFATFNIAGNRTKLFVVDEKWSKSLRYLALVTILARGGMGLNIEKLKKMSFAVLRLALLPNVCEATCEALMCMWLFEMPFHWAMMTGFVMSPVSPAVTVPSLLRLKEQRWGTKKGIPDLVLAAASLDDVLSLSMFYVFLGQAIATKDSMSVELTIVKSLLIELIGMGFIGGTIIGKLVVFLTAPCDEEEEDEGVYEQMKSQRFYLYLLVCICMKFGGMRMGVDYPGWGLTGGAGLAIVVSGLVVANGWKHHALYVAARFKGLWNDIFQPFLFVLIGATVDIEKLNGEVVPYALCVLVVGLAVQCITSYLCVATNQFNIKERLFMVMTWLPKATVQAALGSIALSELGTMGIDCDLKRNPSRPDTCTHAENLLSCAVISIIVTAPIGALMIALGGPRLLEKEELPDDDPTHLEGVSGDLGYQSLVGSFTSEKMASLHSSLHGSMVGSKVGSHKGRYSKVASIPEV